MQIKIDTYRKPNGQVVYIGSDGHEYEPMNRTLNGLFSKDGFFGKVVNTASGIFKKKDGSKTFVGETVSDLANSFGQKLASQVGNQGRLNPQGQFLPIGPMSAPGPTTTLPLRDGRNPLPDSNNKVLTYVGLGLLAIGIPTGLYFYNKGKTKKSK